MEISWLTWPKDWKVGGGGGTLSHKFAHCGLWTCIQEYLARKRDNSNFMKLLNEHKKRNQNHLVFECVNQM